MSVPRNLLLATYRPLYESIARPLIFRGSAMQSHKDALAIMRGMDGNTVALATLRAMHRIAFVQQPVEVGGVSLPFPFILAAGWVKGDGFDSEAAALEAAQNRNIIPGWRAMPALVGPVEFGSFTRWPRLGNAGTVLWRDATTRSTQNRIGLKNPGAESAAEFLAVHRHDLPTVYGINIAVTPGVSDPGQQLQEVLEAVDAFIRRGVLPAWLTLNLSCPNTEDDPTGNQSEELALMLTGAFIKGLNDSGHKTPLWVKVGPTLSEAQVRALMRAFAETGVRAVIATNTLPEPTPDDPTIAAGVAGGRLHNRAVEIACWAAQEKERHGYLVDVIGCGGVEHSVSYQDFARYGADAVQYLSALVFRGPLAAALIQKEALHG